MDINLDDPKSLRQADTQDMLSNIADFPNQLKHGWDDIMKMALPSYFVTCNRISIAGMGASGIVGDLANSVIWDTAKTPILIYRDYANPLYVDHKTLFIAVSYSGNTEETLDAFITAKQNGAKLFAITSGGELERLARKFQCPHYKFDYKAQPRAALGFMLGAMLAAFKKIGILDYTENQIIDAFTSLKDYNESLFPDSPHRKNRAKQIAKDIYGFLPVIYGSRKTESLARRWRGQLAENAKTFGFFDIFPEVNHNSTGGLDFPKETIKSLKCLFLKSKYENPRILTRYKITREIYDKKGILHQEIAINDAKNNLEEILMFALLADYTSYYLAIMNSVDPTNIENIEYLKQRLKEID